MAEFKCPRSMDLAIIFKEITRGDLVKRLTREPGNDDFVRMAEEAKGVETDARLLHNTFRMELPLQNAVNYILGKYGQIDKKSVEAYKKELNEHIGTCQDCRDTWGRLMRA